MRAVNVVYTALPEVLRSVGDLEMLVFGVSLVLVMLFFPRGLGGALDWALERLPQRLGGGAAGGRAR